MVWKSLRICSGTALFCCVYGVKDAVSHCNAFVFLGLLHSLLLTLAEKMRIALCNYPAELLELPEG